MRVIEGDWVAARVYVGEDEQCGDRPLWVALLERLEREGFAGGTAYRGLAGFGAHHGVHAEYEGLPVIVEVAESRDAIDRLLEILEELAPDATVMLHTAEMVRVTADARAAPTEGPPAPAP